MNLEVIYEDNHLIAVNKPANVLVHGDQTGDLTLAELVKAYIKDRYGKPGEVFLGVVHRLDRPASGVVVFARTSKALERMNRLFADRQIDKTYWAVTVERPDPLSGHLVHYIAKDRQRNVAHAHEPGSRRAKEGKRSELSYEMIAEIGNNYLLEVHPQTGRPHQIRVQLSKAGWPIRGDVKYGAPQPMPDGSICLHCRRLSFLHPVRKEPVTIEADTPSNQIWDLFR
ncbi:MAG: RNA pseudouridine synthase [Saprospiraceae bacterium]|nr:MAG: RNA pseudouridine synthase [Saprospiraceae bacterium]